MNTNGIVAKLIFSNTLSTIGVMAVCAPEKIRDFYQRRLEKRNNLSFLEQRSLAKMKSKSYLFNMRVAGFFLLLFGMILAYLSMKNFSFNR